MDIQEITQRVEKESVVLRQIMAEVEKILGGEGEYAKLTLTADGEPMTPEEAKAALEAAALNFIKNFRYGPDKKNFFWVNDLEGKMVMHPNYEELNGQSVTNLRDKTGKPLFREFIDTALQQGSGSVDYFWPKTGEEEPVVHSAFVQLLQEQGWVLGTGLALVTIEAYDMPIEPAGIPDLPIDDRIPASPV